MADDEGRPWLHEISGDFLPRLIESRAPVIRVVAGPGSGKTTGLKRRIQRLVQGDGMDPAKIFVGTFTRAIAKDLRDELGSDIAVSTLHGLALQLLRGNPAALGGLKLRFLLKYEEDAMLYDIASETPDLGDQRARRDALNRQQAARSELADLPDAAFAGALDRWLRRHGGMLIGDVVHLAVQGLGSRDIPPGQFDEVVVDEYQDLTAAEQELVERIWSRQGSLVVLGDNDQSIYSFRYNHPLGIDQFRDRWRDDGLDDLQIPENRRCGETILTLANAMMAEAGSEKPPMISMSGREGDLAVLNWETVGREIGGLARYIRSQDRQFLVLVPRRFIGHRLAAEIGDDARTAFHQEVLENPLVQDRFSALSLVADPQDGVAVRAWLGFAGEQPVQGHERNGVAYGSLGAVAAGREVLVAIARGDVSPRGRGQADLARRARMGVDLIERAESLEPEEIVERLFDPEVASGLEDAEKRAQVESDLLLLREASLRILRYEGTDLPGLVRILRYRIATRAPLIEDEDDPRVRIMTLHSAKGLQADNIILAGMADQMVPGLTEDPALREEQRRLLYVAITRAKHELVISWSRQMSFRDARKNNVREDQVRRTKGEEAVVLLSRSSLLPRNMQNVETGEDWIEQR